MSIDDYKELHDIIKKWIDEKRAAAQGREFPQTTEEIKRLMAVWEKVKSKEIPAKGREIKSLSELSQQLKALKAKKPSTPAIPSEMEYSKLEEVRHVLANEQLHVYGMYMYVCVMHPCVYCAICSVQITRLDFEIRTITMYKYHRVDLTLLVVIAWTLHTCILDRMHTLCRMHTAHIHVQCHNHMCTLHLFPTVLIHLYL